MIVHIEDADWPEVVRLSRVAFDYGLLLLTDDGTEARIEVDFVMQHPGHESVRCKIDRPADFAGLLVASLRQPMSLEVGDDGALFVLLSVTHAITVEPDPDYEAWTVTRTDGSRLVCMPGGEIARWGPDARPDQTR